VFPQPKQCSDRCKWLCCQSFFFGWPWKRTNVNMEKPLAEI